MKASITEIATTFIENMIKILSAGGQMCDIEDAALSEAKGCAAQMVGIYAETIDEAIVSDKASRRESGYAVERRGDERRVQSLVGEVRYERTYFKKASGGYEYLADTALGIGPRSRLSDGLSLALVQAAKDMSYGKASVHAAGGEVSRQTVMARIRQSNAVETLVEGRRKTSELHIDADEAHVTMRGGRNSEVPLISVYEGIKARGKRSYCENVFHISEYGKTPDELWEQALTEIERRYELEDTKIYLHGDGANWIKVCHDWLPQAIFVLDKYHKNKAIKGMTAGLDKERRKHFDAAIREALSGEELQFFRELTQVLCAEHPNRADKIQENAGYLENHVSGISICENDYRANNGGCTEPHVSHILSERLSTRPMAWSKKTLIQLAPILAARQAVLQKAQPVKPELPKPLVKTAAQANKNFRGRTRKWSLGMPHPDAIGTLPITGKVTGTHVLLKLFS